MVLSSVMAGAQIPAYLQNGIEAFKKDWIRKTKQIPDIEIIDSLSASHSVGAYYSLKDNGYLYLGRVNSCLTGGCTRESTPKEAGSEFFYYYIYFDTLGVVRRLSVYGYYATHGQEICNKLWLRQFEGYSGAETLDAGRNVDAISGATISVEALTFDVQLRHTVLAAALKKTQSTLH